MSNRVLTGIKPDTKVLLDGILHTAGEAIGDGRIYRDYKTGDERLLTGAQQRDLAANFRLVVDELPEDFVEHIARARATAFKIFSFADRTVALRRLRYVRAVHELPEKFRHRKAKIKDAVEVVFQELCAGDAPPLVPELIDEHDSEVPTIAQAIRDKLMKRIASDIELDQPEPPHDPAPPTPRTIRRLYRLYYASGQDIRVLLPLHCLKGNRASRYPEWVNKSVEMIIEQSVLCPTPVKYAHALELACNAVTKNASGRELPTLSKQRGGDRVLGKNLISRLVGKIDQFKVTNRQLGINEARRQFSTVELGPQQSRINECWEVDHTLLDIFVIDPRNQKIYARPWLTAVIDRYSRCIVGFSLSFAPPSWVSVTDALRVAMYPKDDLLRGLNKGAQSIENEWKCEGVPDVLVTDHGREFKSRSMDETLDAIGIRPFQTKRRQPWLKGKIERWFGTLEDVLHSLPGTTFAKFYKREHYKSEKFAVLTIEQLNWIIAKWVIDVYHQDDHSKIPLPPAKMWDQCVSDRHVPRKPPTEHFEALMGIVVNRCLRRGGVKYLGLRWDSKAFANLRGRLPHDADVAVRIDPRDLTKAYVWDEANGKWLTGHLKEPADAGSYSLDQWFFIEFNRKENQKLHGMDRKQAVAAAIADIHAFVNNIRAGYKESKAYKRYLEFTSQGLSAWEAVRKSVYDPDEDGPMKPHSIGETKVRAEPAQTGPYVDRPSTERKQLPAPISETWSAQAGPAEVDDPEDGDGAGETASLTATPKALSATRTKKPSKPRKPKTGPAQMTLPLGETGDPPAIDDGGFVEDDFSGKSSVRSRPIDEQ